MAEFTCAWTGETISGKAYLLQTTDGGWEKVSPEALEGEPGKTAQLRREVAELTERVQALEAAQADAGAPAAKTAGKGTKGELAEKGSKS